MIPNQIKDKYGTWWDERSDLALDLYAPHPVLHTHGKNPLYPGRGGTIVRESLEWTRTGLFGEMVIEPGVTGDGILELVEARRAASSTAAMPHLIRVNRRTGYVQRWPLIENSVADMEIVASLPGTTKVSYVRALFPGVDLRGVSDDEFLERSPWLMPAVAGEQVPVPAGVPAPTPPVGLNPPAAGADVAEMIRQQSAQIAQLTQQMTDFQNRPLRSLSGGELQFPSQPQFSVGSKFDQMSLLGMLCLDQARLHNKINRGQRHVRTEEFMRALVDKAKRAFDADEKAGIVAESGNLRCVDALAYEAWHEKVPHLRADEAMQSTLAGSGDELVPTLMNSVAWYAFRMQSRVFQTLDTFQMPSNPYDWPTITSGVTIRKVNEATDQSQLNLASSTRPASKPGTGKKTFTALGEGIGGMSIVSSVLFEDAGLDVAEVLANQWSYDMARAIDYVVINGDEDATTTNISHYGTDPTGTAYDKILVLNGLRKLASGNSDTADLGSLGINDLNTLQLLMGTRGVMGTDLENLVAFVDPGVYYALKILTEFRTFDKVDETLYTIRNGFVGNWDRIGVVLSDDLEWMTADVNRIPAAHNITTGSDSGGVLLVHRKECKVGIMRDIQIEQGPVPHTGLYALSGTVRMDIQCMNAGGVAFGYGVTI